MAFHLVWVFLSHKSLHVAGRGDIVKLSRMVVGNGWYVETCRFGSDPNWGLLKRASLGSSLFWGCIRKSSWVIVVQARWAF